MPDLIPVCLGFMVKDSPKCKACFLYGNTGDCAEITQERKELELLQGRQLMPRPWRKA